MITQVQILPSIYQLQRMGQVEDIRICALNSAPLKELAEDHTLKKAFPGQKFTPYPPLQTNPEQKNPELYKKVLKDMPPQSIVVVAVPDHLHYQIISEAIDRGHHVCTVKPLVLKYKQALEIEKRAYEKGLLIGIEYHKRLDDRALIARQQYRDGLFGEFRMGHAEMNEPYYYRYSNFQNWFTCDNSDMFTYVGCHYVDQLHFITGLLPKAVSVYGIVDQFPNGKKGYLWCDGRVIWENDACLHVTDIMGYPDQGPGGNFQGLRMYCQAKNKAAMLVHNDQYRGMEYCYAQKGDRPGDTYYAQPSPDYFKYVNLGSEGMAPVGYGYRSIEFIINNIRKSINSTQELPQDKAIKQRQKIIKQFDQQAVMATPANSAYNELVIEAARLSIQNNAKMVNITYGKNAGVELA